MPQLTEGVGPADRGLRAHAQPTVNHAGEGTGRSSALLFPTAPPPPPPARHTYLPHCWDFLRLCWEILMMALLVYILTLGPIFHQSDLISSAFYLSEIPPSSWYIFALLHVFKTCDFVVILERGKVNRWALSTILKWKFVYCLKTLDK